MSYFDDGSLKSSKKIIEQGESDQVEFKKSLDKKHRARILETLAAFMNLNGGTIFCGVENENGAVVGVDPTHEEIEEYKKYIKRGVRYALGQFFNQNIVFNLEPVDGLKVLRIDCDPATSPVFYKKRDKNGELVEESFILRSGPENIRIRKSKELVTYVQERFKR